ncbi:MAG: glycosyltransferase family 4 protein [Halioglobus sp.]
MPRILFAWPGLPDYAARCIRACVDDLDADVFVVATKPNVPVKGMEDSLGQPISWLDPNVINVTLSSIGIPLPDILFVGGSFFPAFKCLADEVKRSGSKVVLMSDDNWRGTLRQMIFDPIRYRASLRYRYDSIFVPGESGKLLAKRTGYSDSCIQLGLYGADSTIFSSIVSITERAKRFIYVGQFVKRKNVIALVDAFSSFYENHPDWELWLCGSGPLAGRLIDVPGVRCFDFVQPKELAKMIHNSRCLVLPSHEEHWGVVVHEAALSGCALLLSTAVGSAVDLARKENSITFKPKSKKAIEDALIEFSSWDDQQCTAAQNKSIGLAKKFGPEVFSYSVSSIIRSYCPKQC